MIKNSLKEYSDKERKELMRRNQVFVSELKSKPTKEEVMVMEYLKNRKIRFFFQKGFLIPFHRIVDFYIPKPHKLIIEVDGKIHDTLKYKDWIKDSFFQEKRHFRTIRLKNEEVNDGTFCLKLDNFFSNGL